MGFLRVFLAKMGCRTWFFCGEAVVKRVVNVVSGRPLLGFDKWDTDSEFIFLYSHLESMVELEVGTGLASRSIAAPLEPIQPAPDRCEVECRTTWFVANLKIRRLKKYS